MNNLQEHNVLYISIETLLNLLKKNEEINYSNMGLIIENKYPLCGLFYSILKRDKGGKRKLYVDPNTYDYKRKKFIEYVIYEIVIAYTQLGKRLFSISAEIKQFNKFIKWVDNENYNILNNNKSVKEAYYSYVYYLKTNIRQGKYSSNYANALRL